LGWLVGQAVLGIRSRMKFSAISPQISVVRRQRAAWPPKGYCSRFDFLMRLFFDEIYGFFTGSF